MIFKENYKNTCIFKTCTFLSEAVDASLVYIVGTNIILNFPVILTCMHAYKFNNLQLILGKLKRLSSLTRSYI